MQGKIQKRQGFVQPGGAGQGLVEYALILVLVAVVCIAIMFATGLSIQRVYGLIAGALGAKHNTENLNGERIVIDQAVCYLVPPGYPGYPNGATNVTIHGFTNVKKADLTLATDVARINVLNNLEVDDVGHTFVFRPTIDPDHDDIGLCPRAVIVQSSHGAIATSDIQPAIP